MNIFAIITFVLRQNVIFVAKYASNLALFKLTFHTVYLAWFTGYRTIDVVLSRAFTFIISLSKIIYATDAITINLLRA